MAEHDSMVREIIRDYIEPQATLNTMDRIHNAFTGEPGEFSEWSDVEVDYLKRDLDKEEVSEFALTAKEIIESGIDEIAESYLEIIDDDVEYEEIKSKLKANNLDNNQDSGFRITEHDDQTITGVYFYKTLDVDITSGGNIERLVNEKSIPFRINPDKELIIIESTYSPLVMKLGGVFRNDLDIPVQVCGDITVFPDQAKSRVSNFIDSFDREIPRGDWE